MAVAIGTLGVIVPASHADIIVPPQYERVSKTSGGALPNGASGNPVVTPDGRFVAFQSDADDLVPGDQNVATDIFVHDRLTNTTERVSVDSDGFEADDASYGATISDDGRYVAFTSDSDLLSFDDGNGSPDLYLHDRTTHETRRVSLGQGGVESDTGGWDGTMSADGKVVAFVTDSALTATDLNFAEEVHVRNVATGAITRVENTAEEWDGAQAQPALGRYPNASPYSGQYVVAYVSSCGDLLSNDCVYHRPVMNGSGGVALGQLRHVSVKDPAPGVANGVSFDPAISRDGLFVAFTTTATNLGPSDASAQTDIYLRNIADATTTRITVDSSGGEPNNASVDATLGDDGTYVAFTSLATDLVAGGTPGTFANVYVRDTTLGVTRSATVATSGAPSAESGQPSLSASGEFVVLSSAANNLGTGGNGSAQVIVAALQDNEAPTGNRMTQPNGLLNLATWIPTAWTAFDPTGVQSYDVQTRALRWTGSTSSWSNWKSAVAAESSAYQGLRGRTHCFKVRARDGYGNLSGYSAQKCSALPLASYDLKYSSGWTRYSISSAYAGAAHGTTTKGARMTRDLIRGERLYLVATKCSTCGSVSVAWNGTVFKTINLTASTTQRKQVIGLKAFTSAQSGTITVTTLSQGKWVFIEGLAVYTD
ncbi:MAG TPA: hypothetical protein VFZ83_11665 [Acidimicrobiia bacterium]|nr:hypothetical protein [Acidimicrobiia bacterium]